PLLSPSPSQTPTRYGSKSNKPQLPQPSNPTEYCFSVCFEDLLARRYSCKPISTLSPDLPNALWALQTKLRIWFSLQTHGIPLTGTISYILEIPSCRATTVLG